MNARTPSFDPERDLALLHRTPGTLRALVEGLPDTIVMAQSEGEDWTVYDVLGHLIHGEKTDWVPRLRLMMSDRPDRNFEPFDRFAMFRADRTASTGDLLEGFATLRSANLREVEGMNLTAGDLGRTGVHPEFAEVTVAQLLATWVVHDLSHLAQISRIMAKRHREDVGPWRRYLPLLYR